MPTTDAEPNELDPNAAEQIAALADEAKTNTSPIRMFNFVKFRETAVYPPDLEPDDAPLSGAAAYQRYGELTASHVAAVGASLFSFSSTNRTVLGPSDEEWDQIFIIEYPNRAAFLTMVTSEGYQAIAHHRTAALADSRLILTETT